VIALGVLWPVILLACILLHVRISVIVLITSCGLILMWAADELKIWWAFYVTAAFFIGVSIFLLSAPLFGL